MKQTILTMALLFLSGCASMKDIDTLPEECKGLKIPEGFTEWRNEEHKGKIPPHITDRVLKSNVEGCALLTFNFDKKGKAINVKVLEEYPKRFDIGKIFAAYLLSNTFPESKSTKKNATLFMLNIRRD